jgi:four helix bundle protein
MMVEHFKIQKLQMYQLALAYVDALYELSERLPQRERFKLSSQIQRAATSIVLNIAEGSTEQPNPEQNRFLGFALRSYLETMACLDLIELRHYLSAEDISPLREQGHGLFIKLSVFCKAPC